MKLIASSLFLIVFLASATSAQADTKRGKELYDQRCVSCHGELGAGDGPVAAALPEGQKPANLQSAKFKFATDDAKMVELIKKGGAALGLNPLMPMQPDLNDADIKSLVEYTHSLKK